MEENLAVQIIKKLYTIIIILIFALIGTNGYWIWYNSQFEVVDSWEIETIVDHNNNNDNIITYDKDTYSKD